MTVTDRISIPLIWALASRTHLLADDPMLWWAMMMMPVGPPAMKNLALADVSGTDQRTRMSIAKFLTVSPNLLHQPFPSEEPGRPPSHPSYSYIMLLLRMDTKERINWERRTSLTSMLELFF